MRGGTAIESTEDRVDSRLLAMERRHEELLSELMDLRSKLQALRTQEDYCDLCGDTGIRNFKGGMYGEVVQFPCVCGKG